MLHPRGDAFRDLFHQVDEGLRALFLTREPVLCLTASGSAAMESCVTNLLSPGDRVITVEAGKFGERWTEIARIYGLVPERLVVPWGESPSPDQLDAALSACPEARAVFLTHSETSTGAMLDVRSLAGRVAERSDALVVVDGMSAVGVMPFRMDDWPVDVCVSGSQKGALVPPGLSFVAVGPRAWSRTEAAQLPRFYLDWRRARDAAERGATPWTPAVTLLAALRESLRTLLDPGLERRWLHYAELARCFRAGVRAAGLQVFARHPGNAVTAVALPDGLDGRGLVRVLRERYGVVAAGGQDGIKRRVVRFTHMGHYDHLDMVAATAALELALMDAGYPLRPGQALAGLQAAYTKRGAGTSSPDDGG